MSHLTSPQQADAESPSTGLSPGRTHGGLPLTIRFTAPEYAALLRIAADRSTTASHLIEDLVRYALTHSVVPPAAEPPSRARSATNRGAPAPAAASAGGEPPLN